MNFQNSGKIHDYVGLSEFIQRDDTTKSRLIIIVHETDTFVTHVRVVTIRLSRFHEWFWYTWMGI